MQVDSRRVGPLQTNCYMAYDDTACIIVDPGYDVSAILEMLDGRKLDAIVVTHGHIDHIGALPQLVEATGAPVVAFEGEVASILDPEILPDPSYFGYLPVHQVDIALGDGQRFEAGDLSFEVLHTPGHTPGSMCFYNEEYSVLFSGDTLFFGTCGRTDFPGGSSEQMRESLKRLAQLPAETAVLPGHDRFSTIGQERPWIEGV